MKSRPRRLGILVAVALLPLSLAVAAPAEAALAKVSGLKVVTTGTKAPTTTSLWFQWTWSSKPTKYQLQVTTDKTFKKGLRDKKALRASKKPAGGVQQLQVASLTSGSKYYARVRAIAGTSKKPVYSAWSATKTGITKTAAPDLITDVVTKPGTDEGTVTISWKSAGLHTTGFRLVTSLTSYNAKLGQTGRGMKTTTFGKSDRSHTFTPEELTDLGIAEGSGTSLFGRFYADNKGAGSTLTRELAAWQVLAPRGKAASGTGAPLVVANYNVRTFSADPQDGSATAWTTRESAVVDNIVAADPDVLTLQEVSPAVMTNGKTQSESLLAALKADEPASRDYRYGRSTPFKNGSTKTDGTQAQRVIYDANLFQQVGADCDDTAGQSACAFVPLPSDDRWATYVHLESKADPTSTFWVVSAHFNFERTAEAEVVRQDEMNGLSTTMDTLAGTEPIILGMDSNTWQTYPYGDATLALNALTADGYYDTASSANIGNRLANYRYSTDNTKVYGKGGIKPDTIGFAPRLDVIAIKNLPGSDDFSIDAHDGVPYPGSDHNLVRAVVRLPH